MGEKQHMNIDPQTLKNISMPRYSWDYEDLSEADHWFCMAKANLHCSIHLLSEMIAEKLDSSFHYAKVAVALFEHSIELFLKAGIAQASQTCDNTHELQVLYNRFKNLYPGNRYEFEGEIVSVVRPAPSATHNQYARYPTDISGQPWQGHTHIDLVLWYTQLRRFDQDFRRLEPLMKQRYTQDAKK